LMDLGHINIINWHCGPPLALSLRRFLSFAMTRWVHAVTLASFFLGCVGSVRAFSTCQSDDITVLRETNVSLSDDNQLTFTSFTCPTLQARVQESQKREPLSSRQVTTKGICPAGFQGMHLFSLSYSTNHLKGTVRCDPPTPFPINSPCAAIDWAISVSELSRFYLIRHSNAIVATRLCERVRCGPTRRGCPGIGPRSAMRLGLHKS
jgi:hypothetical protein